MTDDTPLPFDLPALRRKKLTVDFDGGTQSSDVGLLLLGKRNDSLGCVGGWRSRCRTAPIQNVCDTQCSRNDGPIRLTGNPTLDALVVETATNLRFHHARGGAPKLRTYTSITYQAGSWTRPRKVAARLECSLQPDARNDIAPGMRQEVDIRYVVTSLKGAAQHLYEDINRQRGQMENLIKLHKAQLASDRMSCHRATANQVRLAFHTAAFWLMHAVRAAIPSTSPLATAEFTTIRERLIKIGARVIEHIARVRIQLPTSCPERALFRAVSLGMMPSAPRPAGQRAPSSRRSDRSTPNAL